MSDYDHLTAFKTVLTAATTKPTLDLKQEQDYATPGALPPAYVVAYVSRRSIDQPKRLNGTFVPTGYRLTTRVMSKGSILNAYELERLVRVALLLVPITLDGTPVDVRYETGGGDFDKDDAGFYFASTDWIYVR